MKFHGGYTLWLSQTNSSNAVYQNVILMTVYSHTSIHVICNLC